MKTIWQVVALLCVLHVLALLGAVAWLAVTDRINRDRLAAVRELFEPTVAEEKDERERAAEVDAEAAEHAERVAALTGAGEGPRTVAERLAEGERDREVALHRAERVRAEIENLRRFLQVEQERIEDLREALAEDQRVLQERLDRIEQEKNDEGFRKALALYESLPSEQVKRMFMNLMEEGEIERVVTYLEAMQPRNAGKVLEEFETEAELDHAVELTRRLRERGTELTEDLEGTG